MNKLISRWSPAAVLVIAGSTHSLAAGPLGGSLELSSLNGTNGFVINGIDANDRSGGSVSSAGDVNGDGVDDLIIGAYFADPNGSYSGESYVVFGGATIGAGGTLELSSLNGTNGFVINGVNSGDGSGISVSSAGDVNGDGVDDLIIGAHSGDPNGFNSGSIYVVFGHAGIGAGGTLELSSLNGTNGFVCNGVDANDFSGFSVSCAGDVNGDGVDDVIIGAPFSDPNGLNSGECYVVFGGANVGSGGTIELSSLNGTNGFVCNGVAADDRCGSSVSSAGDVNGDGVDDVIIGAPLSDPNGLNSGECYVVFGGVGVGVGGMLELSSLNGANGFVIKGIDPNDYCGRSVSSAGDVNGDGILDLLVGAYLADPNGLNSGESYVVFGGVGVGAGGTFELSSLDGYLLIGGNTDDWSGGSVSSAGDVNGDGVDDLIIGAELADSNSLNSGKSYVVFGGADVGPGGSSDLSSLNGFLLIGDLTDDRCGSSVSSAGDVNGDGVDDLIIGARFADPNGANSGKSYVVFGLCFLASDLNGDGIVDTADLGILIGQFGSNEPGADINGDGVVNTADLGILIGAFSTACP